jgi:hypothetical protein
MYLWSISAAKFLAAIFGIYEYVIATERRNFPIGVI